MFSAAKGFLNNLNQIKYIKNIDRVEMAKIPNPDDNLECNSEPFKDGSKEKIEYLQNDLRIDNLQIFSYSYFRLLWRRTWLFATPAVLASLLLGTAVSPQLSKKKDLPTYSVESTIYNSNFGESKKQEEVIHTNGYNIVDEGINGDESSLSDEVVLKVYDDYNYFTADFYLGEEGKLTFKSGDTSMHHDFTDYESMPFTDCDDKYVSLFDKLVALIQESDSLPAEKIDVLTKLTEEEKKTIIIDVVRYVYLGDTEVLVEKSKFGPSIVLFVLLCVSILVDVLYIVSNFGDCPQVFSRDELEDNPKDIPQTSKDNTEDELDDEVKEDTQNSKEDTEENSANPVGKYNVFPILSYKDGALNIDALAEVNMIFQTIRYKEEFLAAERERILLLWDEICENIAEQDREKLLTKYEKKLIKEKYSDAFSRER
ncbi:MAG: hypothetical protein HFI73_01755 [Bacilli bacterium]|jgi:hypothetical protein|nr:hypothetical protein [Bacilli bacterium]